MFKDTVLSWAKDYVHAGFYIFPVHSVNDTGACTCGTTSCADAGKHPRVQRGLKEASRDMNKIEEWFGENAPLSNIGITTGEISGITVIDVDIGPGKFGAETWAELIKDHGEPQTLMANTGSGGMHLFFQYNSSLKTASNVLGKGVDCRNDGGFVVAAPSRHYSGGAYEWVNWGTKLAPLPPHLSRRKEARGRPKKDNMYKGKYSLEQVEGMLEFVPSDDRDLWRSVGIILGREFDRIDKAWDIYVTWADKAGGKKGRNHDEIMREAFYELSQQSSEKELSIGTIVKAAIDNGWAPKSGEVPLGNFVFYGPGNNFIYRPTVSYWIAPAVDSAVSPINENGKIIKASDWLRANQLITSMTCDPAIDDDYVKGYDCRNGESVPVAGAAMYNTYRRPTIEPGVANHATPFIDHVKKIFNKPGDADQFLDYMAHRVQKPWEKPRFALLIAGGQGVGKDTAVEMCCPAIGAWNVANIDPSALEGHFNEYAASTLVRINEAANLYEMTRWAFNERTKVLIAGSPDICHINPKYGQKFTVKLYCGVIITTNHLASGIYIPADDRRYDVIESATMEEMGIQDETIRKAYFSDLWDWFIEGGVHHIVAFLQERDISKFSANNGQRKTNAHKTVVAGGMTSDSWLIDVLEELGNPTFIRHDQIIDKAIANGEEASSVKKKISAALGRQNYTMYREQMSKDGRWKFNGKSIAVFAKIGTPAGLDPTSDENLNREIF